MSKLFLSDQLLLDVEKPARYIGSEVNAIYKEKRICGHQVCPVFSRCV